MRVLSIQSSVAYGYAGNSAATFPLQRLGHEVWPVNTVHFSNHTGYGSFRGIVFEPTVVADVIRGIAERGVLGLADVVLSGYLGSPGVAEVVLDAARSVRETNPAAVYCCDPVMGDLDKGMFVQPGLPELIRTRVVPAADVLTPNAFELAYLAGTGGDPATATPADVRTEAGLLAAVDSLRERGPSTVLVTSIDDATQVNPEPGGSHGEGDTGEFFGVTESGDDGGGNGARNGHDGGDADGDANGDRDNDGEVGGDDNGEVDGDNDGYDAANGSDTIGMIAVDDSGAFEVLTPRLPLLANGAGDVTAALFAVHLLSAGIEVALARTASSVYAILLETVRQAHAAGKTDAEIALVDSQEAIAHPACEFAVRRIR